MDILKKLPQEIENKVFFMIAEHPCAKMIKELRNKYQIDDDFNIIDEYFKRGRIVYGETRTNFCDNYNLFAITHFTVMHIDFEPIRKDFSNIYSISQTKELFTILIPCGSQPYRDNIERIEFRSEFGTHRIYHHKYGHSYFEFDDESSSEEEDSTDEEEEELERRIWQEHYHLNYNNIYQYI